MPETVQPHGRWSALGRAVLIGAVLGVVLVVGWEVIYTLAGTNLREVVPGHLYRAAQPDRTVLTTAQQRYGVRTILSLRGVCDFESWYDTELRDAEELGLSLEVVGMSAGRLPSPTAARDLCEILDHAEPPLLVHCQRGIDRTGLVSVLYLLLRTDTPLDQARRQLSLRYLHLNAGRTRMMDQFLDLYAAWLREQEMEHSPERLRRWLTREYRPPQGLACLALVARPASGVLRIPLNEPATIPVRVRNDSLRALKLCPGLLGGMYLRWGLYKPDRTVVMENQAGGLRRASVSPGETIDLNVYLPPVKEPGRYRLVVDLFDRTLGSFCLLGSDPLFVELEVP
jgi:hypothetical protein